MEQSEIKQFAKEITASFKEPLRETLKETEEKEKEKEKEVKEKEVKEKETNVTFLAVFFADKVILNVIIDGAADATFDLPLSTHSAISQALQLEDSLPVEPIVLVGDPQNVKMQVIAAQIGKVVLHLKYQGNVILSIGTRWFGRGDVTEDNDFEKVAFVLQHVKNLLQ